ncbi:hypothetical protein M0811_08829 [Anaeramoeba ignava]|uniref:TLDc domain-containing protein n=1 Tax=Anaeramoeba ignava TaxID=1746090 RepID=A0A9Q0RAT3_ANAIG|nr:hypothetical protein M0811_08829 [Anaeramoeba ignava]
MEKKLQEKDELIQSLYLKIEKLSKRNKALYQELLRRDQQLQEKEKENFKMKQEKEKQIEKIKAKQKFSQEFLHPPLLSQSTILNDPEYAYYLKNFISNDELFYSMKLGFSTKNDGFSNEKFHKKCDGKKESLAIIKTTNGFVFGGFTKIGFGSKGGYSNPDSHSFIFTLKNPKNYPPSKFKYKSGDSIYRDPNYSVYFGSGGHVGIKNLSSKKGWSSGYIYGIYEYPKGINSKEAPKFFTGKSTWEIETLEVFFK